MDGGFVEDTVADEVGEVVVILLGRGRPCSPAEDGAGVPFGSGDEAAADLAFGGEAVAVAGFANGLRDALNEDDSPTAVGIFEIGGARA